MNRPLHVWSAFALAVSLLIAAVGWISATTLKLERSEAAARLRAELEENVRLALWRMDSTVAALVSQESARPYFVYSSFYPAQGAYTRMFAALAPGEVMVASPLLAEESPHVLLHFQLDESDALTSPQVPVQGAPLPGSVQLPPGRLDRSRERLATLRGIVRSAELRAAFPPGSDVPENVEIQLANVAQSIEPEANLTLKNSLAKSSNEWRARAMNAYQQRSFSKMARPQAQQDTVEDPPRPRVSPAPQRPATVAEGPVKPIWMGGQLLLARGVSLGGRRYVQGCWLDWKTLRQDPLDGVRDLFPRAALEPLPSVDSAPSGRVLASIPVQLVPGHAQAAPADTGAGGLRELATVLAESPLGLSLVAAWTSVAVAALAVGALLLGVLSLSERRAAFVSAVTHELRTPLTTFRLYTDLLAQDLITDPDKRRSYLETLRREAERLGHLVENVLAYARLERGRSGRRLEPIALSALLERCRTRLEERARATGLALEVQLSEDAGARVLSTDAAAVEQILFNLVDNACKYAVAATDRRLVLDVVSTARTTTIALRDHGPGIPRREARALFVPFSRSAEQASGSAPGVGLGLALSRQLARQLGGELALDHAVTPGARFVLTLPGTAG